MVQLLGQPCCSLFSLAKTNRERKRKRENKKITWVWERKLYKSCTKMVVQISFLLKIRAWRIYFTQRPTLCSLGPIYKRNFGQQKLMYLVKSSVQIHQLLLTQLFLINKTGWSISYILIVSKFQRNAMHYLSFIVWGYDRNMIRYKTG